MKNEYIEYTSVDDLIAKLEELSKKGYGDYPVCVNGESPIEVDMRQYYYDGGYLVRDARKGKRHYLRSRTHIKDDIGIKELCVDLKDWHTPDDDGATIDGRSVSDIDVETWEFLDDIESEEMNIFGGLVKYSLAKTKDETLGCYPFTAYLDSGEKAVGKSRYEAKENLKKLFKI